MKTYKFKIDGKVAIYEHETLGQAFREAKADNPSVRIEKA